jgi:methionine-rich copper-binding protein CopC
MEKKQMTRFVGFGVIALAALGMIGSADAHPRLMAAGPAPGGTVAVSPKFIRIQFSEGIELALSGIAVTNGSGQAQPTGTASVNAKDAKQLIVPLGASLAPGKYTVAWHAVGDDTHHVEGKYNFTVKP